MKTVLRLNEEDFEPTLAGANLPCVVDFYTPWCGPCKLLAPLLEQLAHHFTGRLQFFKVNVEESPALAECFEITGVPTMLMMQEGEVCDRVVGFPSPHELVEKLERLAARVGPVPVEAVRP